MFHIRWRVLYEKMRFKYKFSVLNENTLEEVWRFRISRLNFLLYLFLFAVFGFFLNFYLIGYTPLSKFLPVYADASIRPQITSQVIRIDSLEEQIHESEVYLAVMKGIIAGEIPLNDDDTKGNLATAPQTTAYIEKTEAELAFREQFEGEEKFNLSAGEPSETGSSLYFGIPIKGTVLHPFALPRNYGIDLQTSKGESLRATADGTILYIGYTLGEGYTLVLQHGLGYLSVYKHLPQPTKVVGDYLKMGESFGVIPSSVGDDKPFIHYELWHDGKPQDPATYIHF